MYIFKYIGVNIIEKLLILVGVVIYVRVYDIYKPSLSALCFLLAILFMFKSIGILIAVLKKMKKTILIVSIIIELKKIVLFIDYINSLLFYNYSN